MECKDTTPEEEDEIFATIEDIEWPRYGAGSCSIGVSNAISGVGQFVDVDTNYREIIRMNSVSRYAILVLILSIIYYVGEDLTQSFNYLYFYITLLAVVIVVVFLINKPNESKTKRVVKGFITGWLISIALSALFTALYYPYSMSEMFAAIMTVPYLENAFLFVIAPLIRLGWAVGIAVFLLYPKKITKKVEEKI